MTKRESGRGESIRKINILRGGVAKSGEAKREMTEINASANLRSLKRIAAHRRLAWRRVACLC